MSKKDKAAKRRKRLEKKKESQRHKEDRLQVEFCSCREPEFDAAIRQVFRKFLQKPKDFIDSFHVRIFRCLKQGDKDRNWYMSFSDEEWTEHLNDALESLSVAIFNALPLDVINRCCPDNIFGLTVSRGLKILVTYTQIVHQPTKEGTIHFLSKKNKVMVNRLPAKIAFTTHAFDRIIERCLPNQNTYNGIAMIHSLFGGKLKFEPTDDNEMLRVYFMSRPEDMGLPAKAGIIYVLVGYCPIQFHFAENKRQTSSWVVKTLLVLGMKNTPERKLILELPQKTQNLVYKKLKEIVAFKDIGMFLWFQYNNYPCLYRKTKNGLIPLQLGWSKYQAELDTCKTPKDTLEFFYRKALQKYYEETTILLP